MQVGLRAGLLDVRGQPRDLLGSAAQCIDGCVGVAAPDRLSELCDRAAVAVHAVEHDDPVSDRRAGGWILGGNLRARCLRDPRAGWRTDPELLRGGADDVAEDDPGLDRAELPRVADEDQSRVGAHGLDEPGHQRERDHRRLIDDHQVVRQAVLAIVGETAVASRPPAEQPVQRRGVEAQ